MTNKSLILASAALLMLAPVAYAQTAAPSLDNTNQQSDQDTPGTSEPTQEGIDAQSESVIEGNKEQDTAQPGAPAEPLSPEEEMSPAAGTTLPDEEFAADVASANQFEILSSRMALERAESPEVREFAQDMIDAHTETGERFAEANGSTMSSGSSATATGALSGKHQQALDALDATSGSEFDELYIQMQTKAHEQAVEEFRTYSLTGADDELRQFAEETLPHLEEHLQSIQQVDEQV